MKKILSTVAAVGTMFFYVQAKASVSMGFEDLYNTVTWDVSGQGQADIPQNYNNFFWSQNIHLFNENFMPGSGTYNVISGKVAAWTYDNGGSFSALSGSTFGLISLDASPTWHDSDVIKVTGYLNGSVVNQNSYSINKTIVYRGDGSYYYTYTNIDFGNNFSMIDSVNIRSTFYANQIVLDNIVYTHNTTSPVPIPGAIWLLGSGLAGLTAAHRKKKD